MLGQPAPPPGQSLAPDQLDGLVAPIALYPDPAEDKESRPEFARSADEKLQIEQDAANPDRMTFGVGEQDWPLPVPVVRKDGKWRLDSIRGRLEILARRVGRNELNTMEICRGYVEAQLEYASEDRDHDGILEYAQIISSSPDKHDGLYSDDAAQNPVTRAFPGGGER